MRARPADQALVASDQAAARLAPTGFDPSREVRTVIVQPKYKGFPIWKWVGKRFAALVYFDTGTIVVGVELLEAGVLFFVGPFMVAFAHVRRQAEAFDKHDAIAIDAAKAGETAKTGSTRSAKARAGTASPESPSR